MPTTFCLIRDCLGLRLRIECQTRALRDGSGLWWILCAAGRDGEPVSALRSQGPFHGELQAQRGLQAIIANLQPLGYQSSALPALWSLPLQAELRRLQHQPHSRPWHCPQHL